MLRVVLPFHVCVLYACYVWCCPFHVLYIREAMVLPFRALYIRDCYAGSMFSAGARCSVLEYEALEHSAWTELVC